MYQKIIKITPLSFEYQSRFGWDVLGGLDDCKHKADSTWTPEIQPSLLLSEIGFIIIFLICKIDFP